jgi:hypothetical protein
MGQAAPPSLPSPATKRGQGKNGSSRHSFCPCPRSFQAAFHADSALPARKGRPKCAGETPGATTERPHPNPLLGQGEGRERLRSGRFTLHNREKKEPAGTPALREEGPSPSRHDACEKETASIAPLHPLPQLNAGEGTGNGGEVTDSERPRGVGGHGGPPHQDRQTRTLPPSFTFHRGKSETFQRFQALPWGAGGLRLFRRASVCGTSPWRPSIAGKPRPP